LKLGSVQEKIAYNLIHATTRLKMGKINRVFGISLIVIFSLSSPALLASGGDGGGGGSSGGGSGGGGNGNDSGQGFFSNAYDKGKKTFMEQVVCETCPFASTELDDQGIEQIRAELERDGVIGSNLSYNQRYNVKYYLRKRFAY